MLITEGKSSGDLTTSSTSRQIFSVNANNLNSTKKQSGRSQQPVNGSKTLSNSTGRTKESETRVSARRHKF